MTIYAGDAAATDGNAAFGNIGSGLFNDENGDVEADNVGSHIQGLIISCTPLFASERDINAESNMEFLL